MRSKSVERPATSAEGAGGTPLKICSKMAPADPPLKGGRPAAISYRTMPSEKMSLRASMSNPRACSGDMY
jgi:hypothetical protein